METCRPKERDAYKPSLPISRGTRRKRARAAICIQVRASVCSDLNFEARRSRLLSSFPPPAALPACLVSHANQVVPVDKHAISRRYLDCQLLSEAQWQLRGDPSVTTAVHLLIVEAQVRPDFQGSLNLGQAHKEFMCLDPSGLLPLNGR